MVFHGHRWFFNPGHLQRCNEKSRRGQDREGGTASSCAPLRCDKGRDKSLWNMIDIFDLIHGIIHEIIMGFNGILWWFDGI